MTNFVEKITTRNTTLPKPTFNYKTGKWLKFFLSCPFLQEEKFMERLQKESK
jgi:hypothetical protein